MKEPNTDAKKNFVRGWFPVCFDTGENMSDCLKQLDELIASALSENAESQNIIIDQYAKRLSEAESENRKLKEELDRERVRLAGCGVAAMQNTPKSIKARAKEGDYGWSASYGEVCRALDRKISFRKALIKIMEVRASDVGNAGPSDMTHEERRWMRAFGECHVIAKEALEPPADGKGTKEILDDGFGNQWSAVCPTCKEPNMQIVRPGKVQCPKCG